MGGRLVKPEAHGGAAAHEENIYVVGGIFDVLVFDFDGFRKHDVILSSEEVYCNTETAPTDIARCGFGTAINGSECLSVVSELI